MDLYCYYPGLLVRSYSGQALESHLVLPYLEVTQDLYLES